MQLYLLLLSLVHLAGFLVGTRAHDPECRIFYGIGIYPADCMQSIIDFYQSLLRNEVLIDAEILFGRHRPFISLRATLPQGHPYQTCSVGIDVVNPAGPPVRSTYRAVFQSLLQLYNACVRLQGSGGFFERDGLVYVIVHTASLVARGTCLEPRVAPVSNIAECIAQKAQAIETSLLANSAMAMGSANGPAPPSLPPHPQLHLSPQTDPLAEFDTIEPLIVQASREHVTFQEQLDAMAAANPRPQLATSISPTSTTIASSTTIATLRSSSASKGFGVTTAA